MDDDRLRQMPEYERGKQERVSDLPPQPPFDGRTRQGKAWLLGYREAYSDQLPEVDECPCGRWYVAGMGTTFRNRKRGQVTLCPDCSERIRGFQPSRAESP